MSNPEIGKEVNLSEEQPAGDVKEAWPLKGQSAEETKEALQAPEPTVTGDECIAILKHGMYVKSKEGGGVEKEGIEIIIKNVSNNLVAYALFEAMLYDKQENTLGTIEYKTIELLPNMDHTIHIFSPESVRDKVESYNVRLVKTVLTPTPTAVGNDKVIITKHNFYIKATYEYADTSGVELAIKNVSDLTIATATFEAVFYDIEGNILDTVKHRLTELKPNASRGIVISSSKQELGKIKSYSVKLIRTTTIDIEKVQLRGREILTNEAGEEEIKGTVKNISSVKADAALVVAFKDAKEENIGTKVVILRDIEPNSIKQFHVKFKPQEGDVVRTCDLNIAEIVE